jgi:hypothetical protein
MTAGHSKYMHDVNPAIVTLVEGLSATHHQQGKLEKAARKLDAGVTQLWPLVVSHHFDHGCNFKRA